MRDLYNIGLALLQICDY